MKTVSFISCKTIRLIAISLLVSSTYALGAPDDAGAKDGHIEDVRVLTQDGVLNILTASKDELRAWQVSSISPSDRWQSKHLWHDFVYLWVGLGDGSFVLVVTKDGGELYKVGRWDRPELTKVDGLSGKIKSVWRIFPRAGSTQVAAMAVEFEDASEAPGQSTWKLFYTDAEGNWHPLALAPEILRITGFVRLGPGEIAVKAIDRGLNGMAPLQWYVFRQTDTTGWQFVQDSPSKMAITDLKTFTYPGGMAIQVEGTKNGGWRWLYDYEGREWKDVQELLPGAPQEIGEIKGYADGHVLSVLGSNVSPGESEAMISQYYYRGTQGEWTPFSKVIPGAPAQIFALKAFAGGRGLAFQGLSEQTGRHASSWTVKYLSDGGQWTTLPGMPTAPSDIWDLQPYARDLGFGFQHVADPDHPSEAFNWVWLVRQGNSWISLQKVIPQIPDRIWDVYCEDLRAGIAIQADESVAEPDQRFSWDWFLPSAPDKWSNISSSIGLPMGFPDRGDPRSVIFPESSDANLRNNVLGVWNKDGDARWFLRSNTGWLSIDDAASNGTK